ncbi:MAG: hypothetical protein LAT55_01030 [Opitutales bacterium]|nr:hypothetical protein [Opitutales bacterium]
MKHFTDFTNQRGSSIVFVLIVVLVLSIAGASLIRFAITEKNLHYRTLTHAQAQYGVESTLEHAHAQIITQMQNFESLPMRWLEPSRENLTQPTVLEDNTQFFSKLGIDPGSIEVIGSNTPVILPGKTLLETLKEATQTVEDYTGSGRPTDQIQWAEWVTIDPNDPSNAMDNLAGMRVMMREIDVLGRATAKRGNVETSVFGRQTLEIRDAPLFAYGAFFNMDMEAGAGANMDFFGPVHVNGNLYIHANDPVASRWHDRVTITQGFYHGAMPNGPRASSEGDLFFKNLRSGQLVKFQDAFGNEPGTGYQSDMASWFNGVLDTWRGGLLTGDHGVLPSLPVATAENITEGEYFNPEVRSPWNLISPPQDVTAITHADPAEQDSRREFELAKFSRSASLYIKVNPFDSFDPSQRIGEGDVVNLPFVARIVDREEEDPWSAGTPVVLPSDLITTREGIDLYDPRENGLRINFLHNDGRLIDTDGYVVNEFGERLASDPTEPAEFGGIATYWNDQINNLVAENSEFQTAVQNTTDNFSFLSGHVELPHYDPVANEWGGVVLATLDVGALAHYMESNDPAWWNGVVYIENEGLPDPVDFAEYGDPQPGSHFHKSGIRLQNAGQVPRAFRQVNPDGTEVTGYGFTLITNSPLYIQGHFNADGDPYTGSARDMDDPEDLEKIGRPDYTPTEVPSALIADSITILSDNWEDHLPHTWRYYRDLPGNRNRSRITFQRDATFTEVSAGLISGIVPTTPRNYSGGLENFPRLIENWGQWRHDGDAPPPGPVDLGELDSDDSGESLARRNQIEEFHTILQDMPVMPTGFGSDYTDTPDGHFAQWNNWLLEVKEFVQSDDFDPKHFNADDLEEGELTDIGAWVTYNPDADHALFQLFDFDFGRFYMADGFPSDKDDVKDFQLQGNRYNIHVYYGDTTSFNQYDFGTGIMNWDGNISGFAFRGWIDGAGWTGQGAYGNGDRNSAWNDHIVNGPGFNNHHRHSLSHLVSLKNASLVGTSFIRHPQQDISATSHWGDYDRTLRIRGSMVGLFRSQHAAGMWGGFAYNPPVRDWGFSKFFENGNYPPGALQARSYRIRNYREITAAEYNELKEAILAFYAALE